MPEVGRPLVMNLPWQTTDSLPSDAMARVRRRAIFECCKWDPQAEDTNVLAGFALLMPMRVWRQLAGWAETLYGETLATEREISRRADLLRMLGLPPVIERSLAAADRHSLQAGPRVMRFDFHYTTEGWRISEVNSDVPGGYIESTGFTMLMAGQFPGCTPTANPVAELLRSLAGCRDKHGTVALIHATAYTDDRQVMVYLQKAFARHGCAVELASPADIAWRNGLAHLDDRPCSALLRFFPAEWLPNLGGSQWKNFFRHTETLQMNPGSALISQSKRFPLTWSKLDLPPRLWRELSPETIDPARLSSDELGAWVIKPAMGRVGEGIGLPGVTAPQELSKLLKACRRQPEQWAAQRRFDSVAGDSADGPVHPCFGVYVIDGRAAGIYGRIAAQPLINHQARDVAVLIPDPSNVPVAQLQFV